MVSLRRMGAGKKLLAQASMQPGSTASRLTKQQQLEIHNSQKNSQARSLKAPRVIK